MSDNRDRPSPATSDRLWGPLRRGMPVRRFRSSYVLAVVIRCTPFVALAIWPTRGEFASKEKPVFLTTEYTKYTEKSTFAKAMADRAGVQTAEQRRWTQINRVTAWGREAQWLRPGQGLCISYMTIPLTGPFTDLPPPDAIATMVQSEKLIQPSDCQAAISIPQLPTNCATDPAILSRHASARVR